MINNDKQFYIYIRATKEKVPVSKEEFDSFYKETSVFRRKQQRHKLCCCPKDKRFSCDTDCINCPFAIKENKTSLDDVIEDKDGTTTTLIEKVASEDPLVDEIVTNIIEMKRLLDRICELMPEAIDIGKHRLNGLTDADISNLIGIPRTTFLSRIKKLREIVKDDLDNTIL